MFKKIAVVAFATLALVGCAGSTEPEDIYGSWSSGYDRVVVEEVPLPDGDTVVCITWDGYRAGSITCNWEAVNQD